MKWIIITSLRRLYSYQSSTIIQVVWVPRFRGHFFADGQPWTSSLPWTGSLRSLPLIVGARHRSFTYHTVMGFRSQVAPREKRKTT